MARNLDGDLEADQRYLLRSKKDKEEVGHKKADSLMFLQ